jgi:signal transduction histidine kinase
MEEDRMRLADFITHNIEPILGQWETFAATLVPAAASMDSSGLRDHARQILEAIAKDISTPQTTEAQHEKSLGRAPGPIDASETAAQTHALLRAQRGFSINQMAGEYRALRASVLRLWMDECKPEAPDLNDMIRFNEAVDQALAESVAFFNSQVEQARNLLLGMLGHDMRSPLQTIVTTASYLVALNAGEKVSAAAARLISSGSRMQSLLEDLCDFNRTKLGLGINIAPQDVDLSEIVTDLVDQLRAVHSDRQIGLQIKGDVHGTWDGRRIQQLIGNLIVNAVNYGAPGTPVRVRVTGMDADVSVEVRNCGDAIDRATMEHMFEPLRRGLHEPDRPHDGDGLGLGLYIASEIASAHRGAIDVHSDQMETVFTVRLPRRVQA